MRTGYARPRSETSWLWRRYAPPPHARSLQPRSDRDVNTRYHDGAAADYDAKWGIDYGPMGLYQVLGKLEALGGPLPHAARSLEIGAGTGYFSLNLLLAGRVGRRPARTSHPGCWSRCRPTPTGSSCP